MTVAYFFCAPRCEKSANGGRRAVGALILGTRQRVSLQVDLQSQTLRNQNAIEQIEEPLHDQREHGGGNCALQDRDVIV